MSLLNRYFFSYNRLSIIKLIYGFIKHTMKLIILNLALHLQENNDFFYLELMIYICLLREQLLTRFYNIMKNYYYKQKFIIIGIM